MGFVGLEKGCGMPGTDCFEESMRAVIHRSMLGLVVVVVRTSQRRLQVMVGLLAVTARSYTTALELDVVELQRKEGSTA